MPDLNNDLKLLLAHLEKKNLPHLQVSLQRPHLSLYIEKDGVRQNCCRFTFLQDLEYRLSKAGLSDLWEETPFTGTLLEIMDLVIDSFPELISELEL